MAQINYTCHAVITLYLVTTTAPSLAEKTRMYAGVEASCLYNKAHFSTDSVKLDCGFFSLILLLA